MDNGFSAHGGRIIFRFEEIRIAVSGGDRNHNKFTRTETQKLHDFFFYIFYAIEFSYIFVPGCCSDVDATMLACIAFSCPNLQSMEIFTSNTSTNWISG